MKKKHKFELKHAQALYPALSAKTLSMTFLLGMCFQWAAGNRVEDDQPITILLHCFHRRGVFVPVAFAEMVERALSVLFGVG